MTSVSARSLPPLQRISTLGAHLSPRGRGRIACDPGEGDHPRASLLPSRKLSHHVVPAKAGTPAWAQCAHRDAAASRL